MLLMVTGYNEVFSLLEATPCMLSNETPFLKLQVKSR